MAATTPVAIGGLARWSMTNRTSGRARDGRQRGGQLARPDEQVVGEPGAPDRRMPRRTSGRGKPVGIGLVVDLVADPDEPRRRRVRLGARRSRPPRRVASGPPSRRRRR